MTDKTDTPTTMQGGGSLDPAELIKIITAYDEATQGLQKTHESLKKQVAHLTGELSLKNQELTSSLEEVNALKNYLANILESITDGVIAINPDREVMAFNQSAAEIVRAIASDNMGRPIREVLSESSQELGRILEKSLSEQKCFTNIEVTVNTDQRHILSVSASPIRNSRGEILGAVQSFRDLTDIKKLEDIVTRQNRLAALGEMAAGVAHEIRNPLGGIELYASTLKKRFDPDSKESTIAEKIIAASNALNRIVTDMLTFTRGRAPSKKFTTFERVCHVALDMAAREIDKKSIRITQRHALCKQKFNIDSDQVAQAFLNVILNAVQFMPEGEELIIASYLQVDSKQKKVIIEFEDGGTGIEPSKIDRLFDPFYTSRKDGTGLGLAIVHKIVEDHGGTIIAENRPPRGACFCFTFPMSEIDIES